MADNPAAGGGGGAAAPDHVHKPYCDGYCKNTGRAECISDCYTCGTCDKVVCEDCGGLEDGTCAPCLAIPSSQESTVPESSQESEPKDEVLTFKGLLGRELKMTVQQWLDTPHYMGAYGFKMTAIGSKGSQFTHFVPASALADVPVPISYLDTKAASSDAWVTMDCAAQNNDVAGVTAMLGHEGFMEGVKTMGINKALISAAEEGHVDIVRLLLPRADNSDVRLGSSNHPFGGINSALVHASSANSAAIVELLLPGADQRGANLALMFAINEHVHQDIVRILLPRADLRGINEALRQAVGNGHLPIVEMLVAHGAEVTMNGNEMVFLAYSSNPPATYEPILNFLVAHGAEMAS